jgi:hypothetical protein
MTIKDEFYYKACEEAREDFFDFGARRTDEDVERRAEQLRKEAQIKNDKSS